MAGSNIPARLAALGAAMLGLAPALSLGQPSPAPTQTNPVRGVTITAKADRKAVEHEVHAFVGAIVERHDGESLVRWRLPICPLVAGAPKEQAEFVLQRFSEVAQSVGAPLDGPSCRPNLYIVFTDDSAKLLKLWRAHDRGLFGPGLPAKINHFLAQPRPIRAWYNAYLAGADSIALSADSAMYGGGLSSHRARDSRLHRSTVQNLQTTIVIVDVTMLKGAHWGPVTDYIAMVSLTEINPAAKLGSTPTILRLFDTPEEQRPDGLTAWDRTFLTALHHSDQAAFLQRQQIADRMVDAMTR